jgi:hypothetical protein
MDCNPQFQSYWVPPNGTNPHQLAPPGTNAHQLVQPGTSSYRLAPTGTILAPCQPLERYARNHISDSLILFPGRLSLSFSCITRAPSLPPYMGSFKPFCLVHTSSPMCLFTCLTLTYWLSNESPTCSLCHEPPRLMTLSFYFTPQL